MVLSLRLTSVYLTKQIFDKFGDQEDYGHIEQDSTRVRDPKKKEKRKKKRPGTLSRGGGTVDAKNYSVKTTYLPIGTYLTLVTLIV